MHVVFLFVLYHYNKFVICLSLLTQISRHDMSYSNPKPITAQETAGYSQGWGILSNPWKERMWALDWKRKPQVTACLGQDCCQHVGWGRVQGRNRSWSRKASRASYLGDKWRGSRRGPTGSGSSSLFHTWLLFHFWFMEISILCFSPPIPFKC